jgi:hypothetical protein
MTKGCKFSLYTLKFTGVSIRNRILDKEAYSNLDLTIVIYSNRRLSNNNNNNNSNNNNNNNE